MKFEFGDLVGLCRVDGRVACRSVVMWSTDRMVGVVTERGRYLVWPVFDVVRYGNLVPRALVQASVN